MTKEQIISYFYEQNASYGIKNVFFYTIIWFACWNGYLSDLLHYIGKSDL